INWIAHPCEVIAGEGFTGIAKAAKIKSDAIGTAIISEAPVEASFQIVKLKQYIVIPQVGCNTDTAGKFQVFHQIGCTHTDESVEIGSIGKIDRAPTTTIRLEAIDGEHRVVETRYRIVRRKF